MNFLGLCKCVSGSYYASARHAVNELLVTAIDATCIAQRLPTLLTGVRPRPTRSCGRAGGKLSAGLAAGCEIFAANSAVLIYRTSHR
jgi:hypothetical protein